MLPILHSNTSISVEGGRRPAAAGASGRRYLCYKRGKAAQRCAAGEKKENGWTFRCAHAGGWPCAVPVWNGDYELGVEQDQRRKAGKDTGKATSNKLKGVLLGALVTAVVQSSSATTVMVVGFVNSGIVRLSQAVGVIMGANIGTTATSWILSLASLEGRQPAGAASQTHLHPGAGGCGCRHHLFSKRITAGLGTDSAGALLC